MKRAVFAIFTLVFLALAGIAGGLVWWLGRGGPAPVLLIQRGDGNLAVQDARGGLRPLTTDADGRTKFYSYPVPAPDGLSIAYVQTLHGTSAVTSSLVVQRFHGGPRTIFDSLTLRPFYLHWSPDSRQLAFLASDGQTMLLHTVNTLGAPVPQRVIPGDPSYFSWTPDSQRLLLHTGGSAPAGALSLWTLGDKQPRKLDAASPAVFQAPAWLDDGRTAIAAIEDDQGVALARLDEDGRLRQRLAATRLGMLFTLAPGGKQIAYAPLGFRSIGNLRIVGADGTGDHEVTASPAVTFLWSPDGKRLAYLTRTGDDGQNGPRAQAAGVVRVALRQEAAPNLTWNILDVASGRTRPLTQFVPSTEFLNLLPFFDQYAQSIRLWDKTGRYLVYADDRGVWTLDTDTAAAKKVDDGVVAMWIER